MLWLALWGLWLAGPALAASSASPPPGSAFQLSGTTFAGQAFSMAGLRGRVALVYYWHTGCAVCLDKMPELRANLAGWQHKPFTLVTVQVDRQPRAAREYWQAVALSHAQPGGREGPVLWRGAGDYKDNLAAEPAQWPLSVLVDSAGKVVASWEGRIPAEAWDQIADLLP
jgi:hypothetical protein